MHIRGASLYPLHNSSSVVFSIFLYFFFIFNDNDYSTVCSILCSCISICYVPSTYAAILELYVGLELEERLTELFIYVALCSIMWLHNFLNSLTSLGIGFCLTDVKVKAGFLYSATYTANQNSALHNLGSGS